MKDKEEILRDCYTQPKKYPDGYYFLGTFEGWFKFYVQGRLFRLWHKGDDADEMYEYVYIRQAISLHNDWLIGYATYDERRENKMYPSLTWVRLSEIDLAWVESDEEK